MQYTPVENVRMFHKTFGFEIKELPGVPDEKTKQLRKDLIVEEFTEYCEASNTNDVVGVADALADLLYVVYGAALAWGIPIKEVFNEVHRSNMTKVCPDGKIMRLSNGKVVKPLNYSPPDVASVLNAQSTDYRYT